MKVRTLTPDQITRRIIAAGGWIGALGTDDPGAYPAHVPYSARCGLVTRDGNLCTLHAQHAGECQS